jgi:hypothetical protein
MGTPVEPIEPGLDCLLCFILGKTPSKIQVIFEGIEACPGWPVNPPNGTLFNLIQNPSNPCSWFTDPYTDFYVSFEITESYSLLVCTHVTEPGGGVFNGVINTPCQYSFVNGYNCTNGDFTGGTGRVLIQPDNIPYQLANDYGMTTRDGMLFDRLPCGIDHQVIKLCCRSDKTNVLIYCDNQEF